MKNLLFVFTCSILFHAGFGQTQAKMDENAWKQYQKAETALQSVYQDILTEYQDDALFIEKFKAAQEAWTAFRDAQLNAMYPEKGPFTDNSIPPRCQSEYLTELTEERAEKIQLWIDGISESEPCTGSVKTRR